MLNRVQTRTAVQPMSSDNTLALADHPCVRLMPWQVGQGSNVRGSVRTNCNGPFNRSSEPKTKKKPTSKGIVCPASQSQIQICPRNRGRTGPEFGLRCLWPREPAPLGRQGLRSDRDSEMTDKDLERRKTRHATLSPYANIASSVNLKSGAFTYHPPYPLRRRRHE